MSNLARFLGIVFGWMTLALGLIVTGETALRKFFSASRKLRA